MPGPGGCRVATILAPERRVGNFPDHRRKVGRDESVHSRDTQEIGGTCIELEAGGRRIALDVGLPLDAGEDHAGLLPEVAGFRDHDDSLLGVVISHPHQDHYGLARHVRSGVPVYLGEAANSVLKAASRYVPNGHWFENPRFYRDRRPLALGPFRITPYLVDHSAFDAYALLGGLPRTRV